MLQELFRIPGLDLPIYGFGLMLVIGFLAGTQLAKYLANRSGLDGEVFVNAGIIALLAGVIGCRLSHVLENIHEFTKPELGLWGNLRNALNISSGGLTYYGGFLLAFPTLVAYGLWKKVPIRLGMDIVAPCLMVGLAFGRIGCFLNGCCYGAQTQSAVGVHFPYGSNAHVDQFRAGKINPPAALVLRLPGGRTALLDRQELEDVPALRARLAQEGRATLAKEMAQKGISPIYAEALLDHAAAYGHLDLKTLAANERALGVHPAEIYSSITAFLLAGLLLAYLTTRPVPGHVFALMLTIEPIARFILEMLRVEPVLESLRALGLNWSFSMAVAVPQVLLGVVLWVVFARMGKYALQPAAAPAA